MLFALLVSLLGSAVAIRMAEEFFARNLFDRSELTKIGTAYFLGVISLVILLPQSHLWTWIAVFIPLGVTGLALKAIVARRSREFRTSIGETLALVALKMKSGRSFRQSFSEVVAESRPHIRAKLSEIGSAVVFSQQNRSHFGDAFISELIEELKRVDRQPHSASRRLTVFREKLRVEADFRRRSGQALARIRAQSIVMTVLYVAVAIFIGWKFGFRANRQLFFLSAIFFLAGALWLWRGGRNLKWKV